MRWVYRLGPASHVIVVVGAISLSSLRSHRFRSQDEARRRCLASDGGSMKMLRFGPPSADWAWGQVHVRGCEARADSRFRIPGTEKFGCDCLAPGPVGGSPNQPAGGARGQTCRHQAGQLKYACSGRSGLVMRLTRQRLRACPLVSGSGQSASRPEPAGSARAGSNFIAVTPTTTWAEGFEPALSPHQAHQQSAFSKAGLL